MAQIPEYIHHRRNGGSDTLLHYQHIICTSRLVAAIHTAFREQPYMPAHIGM